MSLTVSDFPVGATCIVVMPTGGITSSDVFEVVPAPANRRDRASYFVFLRYLGEYEITRPWTRNARAFGFEPNSLRRLT